jgi:predicted ArsR family transcriptional regulator
MKDQIMQMIQENPRTVKDLSEALNISKEEVLTHLSGLPIKQVRTVSYGGKSRPVVLIQYCVR